MSKTKFFSFFSVAALAMGLTIPAGATTVIVSAGPFSSVSGLSTVTFDSGTAPVNYVPSGSAVGVVTGSLLNQYAAPTGDTTAYAYVGAGSSWNIGYTTAPISAFGLYWGSADSYNAISFTDSKGVVTTYGQGGLAVPGLSVDSATSSYVTFEDSGALWTSVKLTSSAAAFEFDNVATTTPEPASIALLAGGLLVIGAGAVRRRKSS